MCQTVKRLQICLRCYMSVFRTRTSHQQEPVARDWGGRGVAKQRRLWSVSELQVCCSISRAHLQSTEGYPPPSALCSCSMSSTVGALCTCGSHSGLTTRLQAGSIVPALQMVKQGLQLLGQPERVPWVSHSGAQDPACSLLRLSLASKSALPEPGGCKCWEMKGLLLPFTSD